MKINIEESLMQAELRLKVKMPEEYKVFIRKHAGNIYTKGEWLIPEDLETGEIWGLKNFESFKTITLKDLNFLIPIFNNIKDREMIILDYRNESKVEVLIAQEKNIKNIKFESFYNFLKYIEQQDQSYIR